MMGYSLFFAFLSMAGLSWALCERASDWGTPRWHLSHRLLILVAGIACLFGGLWLAEILFKGQIAQSEAHNVAMISGLLSGAIGYWLFRKFVAPHPAHGSDVAGAKGPGSD